MFVALGSVKSASDRVFVVIVFSLSVIFIQAGCFRIFLSVYVCLCVQYAYELYVAVVMLYLTPAWEYKWEAACVSRHTCVTHKNTGWPQWGHHGNRKSQRKSLFAVGYPFGTTDRTNNNRLFTYILSHKDNWLSNVWNSWYEQHRRLWKQRTLSR